MPHPVAARPETLRFVQTVHDTVYVVVRDTIVRVAEPFHEPMKSGAMSAFEIVAAVVAFVAGAATILAVVKAFLAYDDAQRKAAHHLRTHIDIAKNWIGGLSGARTPTGWGPHDVSPRIALRWRQPSNLQIPLFSGSALSQVTLLQNVFLPKSLTRHLAMVAQSVEAFNDAVAQYNAFKMSDAVLSANVERKINGATAARFPGRETPEDMTQADLDAILAAANLTADEWSWCDMLFDLLMRVHVFYIGNAARAGLFQHLQNLEAEVVRTVKV
jgi:hypothetical protein